ncbi:hypothetical protein NP493_614g00033 [Ridgeia piscesae]|uniref:Uncharacterized protein n=1 Tax=Ridgeia piscesae TaxID=27915 RepID=A0AAD9KT50_RIDPI|nr:hypothetical protein NP493_614g00033 [Ridgeia piscesae]
MPWCNYISESVRKLCLAYDNVFRLLCDEPRDCSASFMFVRQGLPSCKIRIRQIYIIWPSNIILYRFMMCIACKVRQCYMYYKVSGIIITPISSLEKHAVYLLVSSNIQELS